MRIFFVFLLLYFNCGGVSGGDRISSHSHQNHPELPESYPKKPNYFRIIHGEGLKIDLIYTRASSFGPPFYSPKAKAYLHKKALVRLQAAGKIAKQEGYEILVTDAYRPFSVTVALWNHAIRQKLPLKLVAPPWLGSDHNRGIAVDVTLLKNGTCVIPFPVDTIQPDATTHPEVQRLHRILEATGFINYACEWWHFALPGGEDYEIYNFAL